MGDRKSARAPSAVKGVPRHPPCPSCESLPVAARGCRKTGELLELRGRLGWPGQVPGGLLWKKKGIRPARA